MLSGVGRGGSVWGMRPYGFPKLSTCCKACLKRLKRPGRKPAVDKRRARQAAKAAVRGWARWQPITGEDT